MSGRTRVRNQARLVRCSAGCGTLVWLAGALPTTADSMFECASCAAARLRAEALLVEEHPDEFHENWARAASTDPGVSGTEAAMSRSLSSIVLRDDEGQDMGHVRYTVAWGWRWVCGLCPADSAPDGEVAPEAAVARLVDHIGRAHP